MRRTLSRVFGLPEEQIRVVAGRVGGGFGGKQEVLTEDVVALAALKLNRPVQLEFTRTEQFTAATTKHPFTIHLKAGASRDGKLTALQLGVLTNTGAYGNHAIGVMFHGCGESLASGTALGREGLAAAESAPDSALGRLLGAGEKIDGTRREREILAREPRVRGRFVPPERVERAEQAHEQKGELPLLRPVRGKLVVTGGQTRGRGIGNTEDARELALRERQEPRRPDDRLAQHRCVAGRRRRCHDTGRSCAH